MLGEIFAGALVVALLLSAGSVTTAATGEPILSGPLAEIDIKDAEIAPTRGVPKGTFTIAQHFALDPTWLDPQDHIVALTQQHYDYLVHDALIKTMPQGLLTYSLAEHAEATADFTKVAFRLRPGLKFHDGQPLTIEDVPWSYQNYRGVSAKPFKDKLDSARSDGGLERIDDRTIIFHFKEPFLDFMDLYSGANTGIGWIVPKHYYEQVGPAGFKERPLGAGPFKFASQQAGVGMTFEAWDEYWRKAPGVKTIIVKGIRDPSSRLAGLQTGTLDLAYGMTGRVLKTVMKDPNLRWDPNFTGPWWLMSPGYQEPTSPFQLELCDKPLHPYTKALFAASLPSHPDEEREEIVLSGEVPSALNPPSGRHFHPRRPFAMPLRPEARVGRGFRRAPSGLLPVLAVRPLARAVEEWHPWSR
jgi:oligopeptide/dipeptide ABC transporter ATP-binding protein